MLPTTEEVRTLTDDELHGVSGGHLIQEFMETVELVGLVIAGILTRIVEVARDRDPWQH